MARSQLLQHTQHLDFVHPCKLQFQHMALHARLGDGRLGQFHGFRRGQGEADLALQILLLEDAQQVLHPHGARLATHQPGSHHLLVLAQVVLHVGLLGAGFLKLALCGLLRSLGLLPARVEEMAYAPQHQHGHQLGHQDARQGQDGRPHQRKDHRPQWQVKIDPVRLESATALAGGQNATTDAAASA